jgi:hypothetical protein
MAFLFADVVGPRSHLQQAQLSCGENVTVFANMDACTNDPGYREGCGCGPMKNPSYTAYRFGLIPLLAGLFGSVTLIGSLMRRLTFLNSAVVMALVIDFMRAFLEEPNAIIALPFLPFFAVFLCMLVTVWFVLFRGIARLVVSHPHAS